MSRLPRCSFRWLLAALVVLSPFTAATRTHAQGGQKRVLALYSTRRDGQLSILGERDLPRILDVGLDRNVDYYAEFLDIGRSPEPGYREAFRDFVRQKYQGVRFDLVIAMQDTAIGFVNEYGDVLFRGTPVVFFANNARSQRPNSTGLILERNFAATIPLIRQLQPDVRHVFFIAGSSASDREFEGDARRQLPAMSTAGMTFDFLSGLTTADLETRLSHLPEHSAAYYVIVSADPAGARPHPLNYLDRLAAIANAPTYSWVDSTMDHGIVGGSLYSQTAAIERVGELALRVLRGEPPDSIPASAVDLTSYQVDWRQLQRWGIDERRVPAGARIMFRELGLWEQYGRYILAAVALSVFQTVLLACLLIQRTRRRRAEEKLQESQAALIASLERNRDLAGRLLTAQETERSRIARELHDDICQRMLLLTIDLESAARGNDAGGAAAALTVAQDISNSLRELSHQLHPSRLRVIGLVSALESLCAELSHAGTAITCTHDNVPELPPDTMLCLFRVAQEALQNALKYSRATKLSVHMSSDASGLTLTIVDNGVGFDVTAAWGKGVGLGSMVERLQARGGALDLTSRPGAGTRLVATLPPSVLQSDSGALPDFSQRRAIAT